MEALSRDTCSNTAGVTSSHKKKSHRVFMHLRQRDGLAMWGNNLCITYNAGQDNVFIMFICSWLQQLN